MPVVTIALPITATVMFGAIFGFFYAWVCSTMWAFDLMDPRRAIEAMQAVNANVRNAVFFVGFFMTPVVGGISALVLWRNGQGAAAAWFGIAALVYLFGGLFLTMMVNVPMNEALGDLAIPQDIAEAEAIWAAYSPKWQFWNITRTVFSGLALALAGCGLVAIQKVP